MTHKEYEIKQDIKKIDIKIEFCEVLLDKLHIERKQLIDDFFILLKREEDND